METAVEISSASVIVCSFLSVSYTHLQRNALYSIGLILFLFIMCINVILNVFLKRNKEG